MVRKAFRMAVHAESASEYERRHQPIWPELEATLIEHGATTYSIFRDPATNDLFAYVELESEQRWAAVASTDVCRRWWQYMRDLMPVNADGSPVAADLRKCSTSKRQVPADRGRISACTSGCMAETVSDFLVSRLAAWGVTRLYGYPGDGINGIMGALDRAADRMQFIQVRHEEMAAFMACAHAKFTGEVGVCLATSGPGAIHLLNGLYDAKLDHQPVVAIVGQQARTALGGHYQQEVDLVSLFKDVAHEYVQMATTPEQIRISSTAPSGLRDPSDGDVHHHSERLAGARRRRRRRASTARYIPASAVDSARDSTGRRSPQGCRPAQRRRAGGDAGWSRGAAGDRRGARGG